MSRDARKLFLIHFVTNALLLWLGYEWLGMGESSGSRLVLSALAALGILALLCWLHGAAFAFFRMSQGNNVEGSNAVANGGGGIGAAFGRALRHLLPLTIAALLTLALYGAISWAFAASGQPAFKIASWLTLKWRTPVRPSAIARAFNVGIWILRWAVLPVVLLPIGSGVATRGWLGFSEPLSRSNWRYWLLVPALLAAGFLLPFAVLAVIPAVTGFAYEFISFAIRALLAYLLLVSSALALAFATAKFRAAVAPSTASAIN